MGNACASEQRDMDMQVERKEEKSDFADSKEAPQCENDAFDNVGTSYNTRHIAHTNARLPGASTTFVTGKLMDDVNALWNAPKNNDNYQGYWDVISKEIVNNKHIPYPDFGLSKDNLSEARKGQGIPLLPRRWHYDNKMVRNSKDFNENSFTVLQFNMLADGLSGAYYQDPENNSKAFLNVNPRCLEWSFRGIRLMQEILLNSQWNKETPDIIALEECDQFEWMLSYLKCYGYDGRFIAKADSPCPSVAKDLKDKKERGDDIEQLIKDNGKNGCNFKDWTMPSDGCALFWKTSKFQMFDDKKVIAKSTAVYLCNTRPSAPTKDCLKAGYKANRNDWDPFSKIPNWNKKKEDLMNEALNVIKENEDALSNLTTKDDEKKLNDKSIKKLEKKYSKMIKEKTKLVDSLKKFDPKSVPSSTYQPILSEEKGKLVHQACTFLCVPLQWKNNKNKRFYAMVTHLKSTKSAEGEKVRVGQLQAIFGAGDIFGKKLLDSKLDGFDEKMPILFCLDLNGKHTNTFVDEDSNGGNNKDEKVKDDLDRLDYCHEAYDFISSPHNKGGLGFDSVNVLLRGSEPEFTTWKQRRDGPSKHTIDFVFVKNSEKLFTPVAYLDMKEANDKKAMEKYEQHMKEKNEGLIPDWHYPSDHFSLAFRMKWDQSDASNAPSKNKK